jgi:anti-sigma factor RsiW
MTQKFECGDNAALVGYLYDESEPGERSAIEAHLRTCSACTAEIAALGATRLQLAAWTPRESELGFRIVAEPRTATVLRPRHWWQRPMPAWAQAAAAMVIFGAGLSLGILRGTPSPAAAPAATNATVAADVNGGVAAVSRTDLAALEQRLRSEMVQQVRSVAARTPAAAPAAAGSDAQLLARVRALIDESEQRQRRELALRTADLVREADAQRQFDLARIQRVFGQFEGTAGLEIQRQRQDLNNLIRVSQRPQ